MIPLLQKVEATIDLVRALYCLPCLAYKAACLIHPPEDSNRKEHGHEKQKQENQIERAQETSPRVAYCLRGGRRGKPRERVHKQHKAA